MPKRIIALPIIALLALAACGSEATDALVAPSDTGATTADAAVAEETTTTVTPAEDPYEVYLQLAADIPANDQIELSREDAQLRAMLGCGSASAPGTVDGLLAEAYVSLIEQWKADGMCG